MGRDTRDWSEQEVKRLIKLHDKGKGWEEVGFALERSSESCRMKYRHLQTDPNRHPESYHLESPRVGIVDVETLPIEAYVWNMYPKFVNVEQVISDTGFLSWAGKFLNDPTMYSDVLTPEEALEKDDERITKSCWDFISQCDVVVGHNLMDFDSKVMSTFFLKYGLPPLKYVMVDTLKIARRHFRFGSNKMAYINRRLGIREKIENEGFPLWRKCREGDADALATMLEYNEGDILATEDLFYKIRPYAHSSFNVALYNEIEEQQCPVCGNTDLKRVGWYVTPAGRWDSLRCTNCTGVFRGKTNHLTKEKRKSLLVNS